MRSNTESISIRSYMVDIEELSFLITSVVGAEEPLVVSTNDCGEDVKCVWVEDRAGGFIGSRECS